MIDEVLFKPVTGINALGISTHIFDRHAERQNSKLKFYSQSGKDEGQ